MTAHVPTVATAPRAAVRRAPGAPRVGRSAALLGLLLGLLLL